MKMGMRLVKMVEVECYRVSYEVQSEVKRSSIISFKMHFFSKLRLSC